MLKSFRKRKNVDEIETPKEHKERMKGKRAEGWSGEQLQFKRETEDFSGVSWNCMRTGDEGDRRAYLSYAKSGPKENALKARIENQNVSPKSRMSGNHMTLCSIFCVVHPSLCRQIIKRGIMLLGRSYIGRCPRSM